MTTSTLDQLAADFKEAMRAKDKERSGAIKMIRAALKNAEIDKGSLSEDDIVSLLSTEAKKRRDSAQMYRDGDREDLASKEEYELEIILSYLPKQLTDDDVRAIIDDIIAQTGASSKADLGKVMGPMMGRIKGRFDGSRAKNLVMEKLS